MKYSNRLREARKKLGFNQTEMGEFLGTVMQNYQKYEYGDRQLRSDQIAKVCGAVGCSSDWLIMNDSLPKGAIVPTPVETVPVPVYGRIAAGEPLEMCELVEEVDAPVTKRERHPYAYFLIVSGDSMNNEILDGHLALIDPKAEVKNGDTVAVNVNGYDATLKVWHRTSNSVILSPNSTNPEHRDIVIDETSPDAPNLRVLGKKVWAMYPE